MTFPLEELPRNLKPQGVAQQRQSFDPILAAQNILGDFLHFGQPEKAREIHQRAPGITAVENEFGGTSFSAMGKARKKASS